MPAPRRTVMANMYMLCVMLLLLLVVHVTASCSTVSDCNNNGVCTSAHCDCRGGWFNTDCSYFVSNQKVSYLIYRWLELPLSWGAFVFSLVACVRVVYAKLMVYVCMGVYVYGRMCVWAYVCMAYVCIPVHTNSSPQPKP